MKVYGIKNCNTVKSALDWLRRKKVAFEFYDLKKGITSEELGVWCKQVGWETLVNKKGTTWRQLDEKVRITITNELRAINLMQEKTSLIKRPVLEKDGKIIAVGFDESTYEKVVL
jgi:arsenate reductase (glutaredoxin)